MASKSNSVIDAANEYFDSLIKSRFVEMFGDLQTVQHQKLSEICVKLGRGKTPKYVEESDCYIIGQACIRWDEIQFDRVRCLDQSKYKHENELKSGDILFNSTGVGSLGRCCVFINPDKRCYVTDSHVTIIRLISNVINPVFLHHYLSLDYIQTEIYAKCVNGSTNQIELNAASFANFDVPVPEISKQNQFADFVKQVDKSKLDFQKLVSEFDELIKSRFIEMFGQIDLSSQCPEWNKIKDVGVVLTGSTPKTGVDEYWDGDNLWITPAELTSDRKYYDDTRRKITDLGVKSCSLDQIEPGTVLLTSRAPIGKVGIATSKMYCNQGFKNIKCGPRLNPEYLYTLIFYNTEYLNSLGRGATFKEISRKIVESIRIPVPSIELQNQFADFVRQVDKSKSEILEGVKKLKIQ